MGSRVIQANFAGGQLRSSALMRPPATSWPAPPPRPTIGGTMPLQPRAAAAPLPIPAQRQAREAPGRPQSVPVDPAHLGLVRGGGKPLPPSILAKMEAAFRQDFSAVRVHEGPQATRIGALAFTIGTDIYFEPGRFEPHSARGQQILGHELAHVVQQRQGRVRAPASGVALVQDPALELEADRLGRAAAMTQPAIGERHPARPGHGAGGAPRSLLTKRQAGAAQPMFSKFLDLFKPSEEPRPPPDMVMEEIVALSEMSDNIVVAFGAISAGNKADVLAQMKRFMAGTLTVWRGVMQCHPAFPASPYTAINAKVPGSTAAPDFGDNNNNWIPFYEDKNSCLSVALSWSSSIAGYFRSVGGMDSSRPVALLLEKTLHPSSAKVAFGMAPEVQIWGPTTATVTRFGIDDDWSVLWPGGPYRVGDTFRSFAAAAGVTIT